MDLLEDSQGTMRSLNARLKGFLEQVNRLQETNRRLEDQIVDWGYRNAPHAKDWSQQEKTVGELRAQVGKLLMENAQLALQSDNMRSRAAQIQARCEMEERQTRRLEQQVALLSESKRRAEHTNTQMEAELHRSMTELQEMHHEFETAQALQQQQRSGPRDTPLAPSTAGAQAAEENGTGMELSQLLDRIRAQCDRRGPADAHPGPAALSDPPPGATAGGGRRGVASASRGALAQEEVAWAQVNLGGAALREARAELAEARKQWHSLEVEIQTLHALEKGLESSLHLTQRQYSSQLQDLTQVVAGLEGELDRVRGGLAAQRQRHGQLLNTKMKLEREIATYRRLLEREEGRYPGRSGQPMGLRPWRGPVVGTAGEPRENGVEDGPGDPPVTPDEPKSEPLPVIPPLLADDGVRKSPAVLRRQQSLVILTEPERDSELRISTVKTQEILQGNVVRESAEGHGTVETEKIDKVIKQWEGSFFKGNPRLRKKSVSLRFDLHMAAADEGCAQTRQDSLPDVEVRLVMKRSRSIPAITQ